MNNNTHVVVTELNNILQLKSQVLNLSNTLSKSKNVAIQEYAVRMQKSAKKLSINIDDENVNIKAVNLSKLRFDPCDFYYRKQQILCNLNSNITEMLFEDISNIFVIVNFPLEKCHVSQISQTIPRLNKAFLRFTSSFCSDTQLFGFLKHIKIHKSDENDFVNINIASILHMPYSFLTDEDFEKNAIKMCLLWEKHINYVNGYDADCSHFSLTGIDSLEDFENIDESFIHFYDLSDCSLEFVEEFINQTHRKKLFETRGTLCDIMK
jgi:hypothetical protein